MESSDSDGLAVNDFCDNSEVMESALDTEAADAVAPLFYPWKRVVGKHESEIIFAAFIANGTQAVSCCRGGEIMLWDTKRGRCLNTITIPGKGFEKQILDASISRNGKLVVIASRDMCLYAWDLRTSNRVCTIEAARQLKVAFSPVDNSIVASAGEKTNLWDINSGECMRTLAGPNASLASIAFSPCGKLLARVGPDATVLWDVATGERLKDSEGSEETAAFSPDGRCFIAASSRELAVCDVQTTACIQRISTKTVALNMALSKDSQRLFSYHDGGLITLWDLNSGEEATQVHIPSQKRGVLSLSPDGTQLLVGGDDGALMLVTLQGSGPRRVGKPYKCDISALSFSPDGSLLVSGVETYGTSGILQIICVDTGEVVHEVESDRVISAIAFSPNGRQIATGSKGGVAKIWSLGEELVLLRTFRTEDSAIFSITFSVDSKLLIAGCDARVMVWDASSGATLFTLHGHDKPVSRLKVTPEAPNVLHSVDEDSVKKVWNLQSGKCIETLASSLEHCVVESQDYSITQADYTVTVTLKNEGQTARAAHFSFESMNKVFAFCETRAFLALLREDTLTLVSIDALMDSLKRTPEGFVPNWYLFDLFDSFEFDALVQTLRYNPNSISNNQWFHHTDSRKSIFLALFDEGKVDVMKQLLAIDSSSCHFYRADVVLNYIIESSHAWKDEVFEAILSYFTSRTVSQSLPAFDDDSFFDCLATAAKDPSLRPKVVDFLASTPLKQARMSVADGFTNGTAKFGDSLTLAVSSCIDAPRIWKYEEDEGKLPTTGETNFSEFLVTPFPGIVQSNLLDALVDLNLSDLFDTIMVRSVVDYKWKQTRRGYIRDTWIYFFFLAMLSTFSILFQQIGESDRDPSSFFNPSEGTAFAAMVFGIVCFVVDPVFTLAQELLQIRGFGARVYFSDLWNWLDILRVAFCVALIPLVLLDERQATQVVLAIALYLRWFGFLFYFQAFSGTGHLVRMIIQITKDIRYLLMIFVLSILAASFAFNTLQPASTPPAMQQQLNRIIFDFFNILILNNGYEPNELVYAGYPTLRIILFIISMIFVPIILLNLLIALMSDSFERIQDKAFVELNILRAKIIKEQEYNLFNLFGGKKEKMQDAEKERYLHVMMPKGKNQPRADLGEYQGVLNAMKRHTSEAAAGIELRMEAQEKQIASVRADMKAQLKELDTKFDELKQWMQANVSS